MLRLTVGIILIILIEVIQLCLNSKGKTKCLILPSKRNRV